MSAPKIIIVGGGISGLVANWELRDSADIVVMEPGKLGGEFTAGGLKYIHRTDSMEDMFTQLGLQYSTYIVRGGILLQGQMYLYPQVLQGMSKRQSARIQRDHYRKTRRTAPGDDATKAMNDPAATGPRRALRCDFEDFIDQLADQANVVASGAARVDHERNVLFDMDGRPHRYDFLIMTTPLWITKRVCSFYVPEGAAMRLNAARVYAANGRFASFDYVYTPYTPADAIHRFSPSQGGYSVEINGTLDRDKMRSDLAFIFPDGYVIESVREGLKGHLLALPEPVQWPPNIAPIGRFSSWNPRATTDVALEDARALKERWLL